MIRHWKNWSEWIERIGEIWISKQYHWKRLLLQLISYILNGSDKSIHSKSQKVYRFDSVDRFDSVQTRMAMFIREVPSQYGEAKCCSLQLAYIQSVQWLLTIPNGGAKWFSLQFWHQINVKHHYSKFGWLFCNPAPPKRLRKSLLWILFSTAGADLNKNNIYHTFHDCPLNEQHLASS